MRRTQLYLDNDLWMALHIYARQTGTTVSEVVRQAAREKLTGQSGGSKDALKAAVGLWADRKDMRRPATYVRSLRKGSRLARVSL